ncbi:hypothetical protein WKI65_21715 [Streptomyces sp. MS1.AVA.3]|uniref:hypothetical protein n=1 Tax=Streptomyces decoyicus TaxID=249567 RepID=UPI0030BCE1DC
MGRLFDEAAHGGQGPGAFGGELPQQSGELRGGVGGAGLPGGVLSEVGLLDGLLRIRAGSGDMQAQLGLDAPALGCQERQQSVWLGGPGVVGPDEVGEQVEVGRAVLERRSSGSRDRLRAVGRRRCGRSGGPDSTRVR